MKFLYLTFVAAELIVDVEQAEPLAFLEFLVTESGELIDQWPCYLPSSSAWKAKFVTNAARMKRSFSRKCGAGQRAITHLADRSRRHEAASISEHMRHQHRTFADSVRYVTDSFANWAELYMTECMDRNMRNKTNQVVRMRKWNKLLQDHLHC